MPSTHGPIGEEYRKRMHALASVIDEFFNGPDKGHDRKTGFMVLIFPFGLTGDALKDRINYISNAERSDMLTAMKEFIARAEGRHLDEQPGGGSNATN